MESPGHTPQGQGWRAQTLAEAEAWGVDLRNLRHGLTLTPSRRLAQMEAMLRSVLIARGISKAEER
ncbi:MAG: hypothetical protein HY784_03045 [Chloroflexi bacterium]|nr:hypothetical protein [Chloroflexota bacterium]